ncbi:MAG: putative toxin-antitoxin system toxin component, PIN family [Actinobacteria bacterium]|nr:putative toxin-antitoxin system toxin component, PIN family [Actinomycetota bacterium]
MRVALDTNVLVSAFVFPGGSPESAYRPAVERRVWLITSRPLLVELVRVLVEKFGWEPICAEEGGGRVAQLAEIVEPEEVVDEIQTDPADNRVLEAALAGKADVIVSGDHHLLDLLEWRGIRIQNPSAFLQLGELE